MRSIPYTLSPPYPARLDTMQALHSPPAKRTRPPRLVARRGVVLHLPTIRSLGLTWGQRPTGEYLLTKEGWAIAQGALAIIEADVFTNAAQSVAAKHEEFCCFAISCTGSYNPWAVRLFEALFSPRHDGRIAWYTTPVAGVDDDPQAPHIPSLLRLARTLGLLLCAELVREGFTPDGWNTQS